MPEPINPLTWHELARHYTALPPRTRIGIPGSPHRCGIATYLKERDGDYFFVGAEVARIVSDGSGAYPLRSGRRQTANWEFRFMDAFDRILVGRSWWQRKRWGVTAADGLAILRQVIGTEDVDFVLASGQPGVPEPATIQEERIAVPA